VIQLPNVSVWVSKSVRVEKSHVPCLLVGSAPSLDGSSDYLIDVGGTTGDDRPATGGMGDISAERCELSGGWNWEWGNAGVINTENRPVHRRPRIGRR